MNEVLVEEAAINPVLLNVPSKHHTPIACRVRIGSSFDGKVIVSATFELANRIAVHMFKDDLDGQRPPTPREARDALREVANIVAGNLKPLLGANNQLGIPEDLAESTPPAAADPVVRATLEHRAGALDVVVYSSL